MADYLEHDKMAALYPKLEGVNALLDWLETLGLNITETLTICRWCKDTEDNCECADDTGCPFRGDPFADHCSDVSRPVLMSREQMIASCFGIDRKKLESERRAMLEANRVHSIELTRNPDAPYVYDD